MSTQTDVYRAAFALLDGLKTHEDKGHEGERLGECVIVTQRATLGDALHNAHADDAIEAEDTHSHAIDADSYEMPTEGLYLGTHAHPFSEGDSHVHAPDWRPL